MARRISPCAERAGEPTFSGRTLWGQFYRAVTTRRGTLAPSPSANSVGVNRGAPLQRCGSVTAVISQKPLLVTALRALGIRQI